LLERHELVVVFLYEIDEVVFTGLFS